MLLLFHVLSLCLLCLACSQVYLGEQYVNSTTLSDVTFLVEGRFCCQQDVSACRNRGKTSVQCHSPMRLL